MDSKFENRNLNLSRKLFKVRTDTVGNRSRPTAGLGQGLVQGIVKGRGGGKVLKFQNFLDGRCAFSENSNSNTTFTYVNNMVLKSSFWAIFKNLQK